MRPNAHQCLTRNQISFTDTDMEREKKERKMKEEGMKKKEEEDCMRTNVTTRFFF
jgi:hypothetical protein